MLSKYDKLAEPTVSIRGVDSFHSQEIKITGTKHLHTVFLTLFLFTFSGKTLDVRGHGHMTPTENTTKLTTSISFTGHISSFFLT